MQFQTCSNITDSDSDWSATYKKTAGPGLVYLKQNLVKNDCLKFQQTVNKNKNKLANNCYWSRSSVFIFNFEHFRPFSSVSIVEFEQVNVTWEALTFAWNSNRVKTSKLLALKLQSPSEVDKKAAALYIATLNISPSIAVLNFWDRDEISILSMLTGSQDIDSRNASRSPLIYKQKFRHIMILPVRDHCQISLLLLKLDSHLLKKNVLFASIKAY